MGIDFQFCKMKEFWRWMLVIATQQCEGTEYHGTIFFKIARMMNFMFICFYHNKKMKKKKNRGSETCKPLLFVLFYLFEIFTYLK